MKILVATSEGQGHRESDFCYAQEGEPVFFQFPCDRDRSDVDGGCGCHRGLTGIDSGNSTTTFKVVDINITKEELAERHFRLISESGNLTNEELEEQRGCSHQDLSIIWEAAQHFPVGVVLERRGFDFQTRPSAFWRYPQNEINDFLI